MTIPCSISSFSITRSSCPALGGDADILHKAWTSEMTHRAGKVLLCVMRGGSHLDAVCQDEHRLKALRYGSDTLHNVDPLSASSKSRTESAWTDAQL